MKTRASKRRMWIVLVNQGHRESKGWSNEGGKESF